MNERNRLWGIRNRVFVFLRETPLFLLVLLFMGLTPFLNAQQTDFNRRIVWKGGENALRYAVEIDKSEAGSYLSQLREFTTSHQIDVSLPAGEYRFRIIPYDILDRPGEGTQWMTFEISAAPKVPELSRIEAGQIEVINVDDYKSTDAAAPEPAANPQTIQQLAQTIQQQAQRQNRRSGLILRNAFDGKTA